ncbi:MAG: NUDIX hydrolase [Planctomycetales bacterium]|nr:NUDIX hydrolase [Planctomycetales bacterium]
MKPKTLLTTSRFDVVEHLIETSPDQPAVRRQVVVHPGAVVIVPMVDADHVCLIRNHRVAVGKTLVELPAGTLDRDEPPRDTAIRELQEETGYIARHWQELPPFFMSPGILNERMHLFVAQDLAPGEPAREAGEEIENLVVDWQEAVRMAESGEIEDAKSLVGILLWDRLRQKQPN